MMYVLPKIQIGTQVVTTKWKSDIRSNDSLRKHQPQRRQPQSKVFFCVIFKPSRIMVWTFTDVELKNSFPQSIQEGKGFANASICTYKSS